MSLRVEAIKFNHDPNAASHDALTIRRNATQTVNVPEWRRGISVNPEDSPAAYAMRPTQGNDLTIKVRLSSLDPELQQVEVRARDATVRPRSGPGGCLGLLRRILEALARLLGGNVLGEVKARQVTIPPGGLTGFETFQLERVALWAAGVGVRTTEWQWQYRPSSGGPWIDVELSKHRIYTVVDVPTLPWNQTAGSTSNPWTEVLDHACNWALLAKTGDEAATRVTTSVFGLGPSLITYDCPGNGGTHYAIGTFKCTKFLERLKGGFGLGQWVNCSDCATITSTFANALGADLWQSRMEEPPSSPDWGFELNPTIGIGGSVWQTTCGWPKFNYHEVAWKAGCTANDELFDACLQVDGDADPTAAPHTALQPTNLRFGAVGAGLYRDRLATPVGRPDCEPNPGSRRRRAVV